MRKRIAAAAIIAAALVGMLLWAVPSAGKTDPTAQPPPAPVTSPCPTLYRAAEFRTFAGKVWHLDRWRRARPPGKAIAAMRRMRSCAINALARSMMQEAWRRDKRRFYRHRAAKQDTLLYEAAISPPGIATLDAIAACESGGDPSAVSSDGTFRGKYQFDYQTWESVGGHGDPAAAPEREQDERAALLYQRRGSSPWPVCG